MSSPLVVQIGMARTSSFRTESEGARQDMERIKGSVNQTSAELVSLQRAMRQAGGGTAEQTAQVRALRKELTGLKADLRTATTEFETLSTAAPEVGLKLAGGKRLRKGVLGLESAAMSLAGGGDVAGAALGGVQSAAMAMQLGTGAMVGVAATALLASKIIEARKEAVELREALRSAMSESGGGAKFQGQEEIEKTIAGLDKAIMASAKAAIDPTLGQRMYGNLSTMWAGMTGGKDSSEQAEDLRDAAERKKTDLSADLVRLKGQEVALEERAAHEGEASVAVDREQLKLVQEIGKVRQMVANGLDGQAGVQMIAHLTRESQLRQEHLRLAKELKDIEESLADHNLSDRAAGTGNAVTKAQNALDAAHDEQVATRGGTPEGRAADRKVRNAELQLDEAKRALAQKQSDDETVGRLANEGGSASQQQRAKLEADKRALMERAHEGSKTYETDPDKRKEIIDRLLPEKEAQLRTLDQADRRRELETRSNNIQAAEGRGPEEHAKALQAEIKLLEDRGKLITEQAEKEKRGLGVDEQAEVSGYAAGIARLKKQVEDLGRAEKDRLATIQQQTTTIGQQGYSVSGQTKASNIGTHYDRQIERARSEGVPQADVDALRQQKEEAQISVLVDEEMMTPGQRRQRDEANRRRGQAEARVRARGINGDTKAREADGNKSTFDPYFHGGDHLVKAVGSAAHAPRRPDPHGAAPKTAAGQDMKVLWATSEGYLKTISEGVNSLLA